MTALCLELVFRLHASGRLPSEYIYVGGDLRCRGCGASVAAYSGGVPTHRVPSMSAKCPVQVKEEFLPQ